MARLAGSLDSGTIMSVDYGLHAEELYSDLRPEGTALCHFRHSTNREFYKNLGLQDITCHVNFTALVNEGKAGGLNSAPVTTQTRFLLDNGMEESLAAVQSTVDERSRLKTTSAIKTLIHPEGMGGTFKVLIQRK